MLSVVEWIERNEVRLCFTNGRIVEVKLPEVKDARRARLVDDGAGPGLADGQCSHNVVSWGEGAAPYFGYGAAPKCGWLRRAGRWGRCRG